MVLSCGNLDNNLTQSAGAGRPNGPWLQRSAACIEHTLIDSDKMCKIRIMICSSGLRVAFSIYNAGLRGIVGQKKHRRRFSCSG